MNWGMLPFLIPDGELPFTNGDYLFIPGIKRIIEANGREVKAYVVGDRLKEFTLNLGDMTADERQILLDGCLINYYRAGR